MTVSTFHTTEGTVRYSGIRRYIVVKDGRTVKRTDSIDTAEKTAAAYRGVIVDTKPVAPAASAIARVCSVCGRRGVPEQDWVEYNHRHWHCIPAEERERISAEWRAARAIEDSK